MAAPLAAAENGSEDRAGDRAASNFAVLLLTGASP